MFLSNSPYSEEHFKFETTDIASQHILEVISERPCLWETSSGHLAQERTSEMVQI